MIYQLFLKLAHFKKELDQLLLKMIVYYRKTKNAFNFMIFSVNFTNYAFVVTRMFTVTDNFTIFHINLITEIKNINLCYTCGQELTDTVMKISLQSGKNES